jgi:phosphatidate cytidylyltransferase
MNDRLLVALVLVGIVAGAFALQVFFLLPLLVCALGLWEWWPLSKSPACSPWMRTAIPAIFFVIPAMSFLGLEDAQALVLVMVVALTDTTAYIAGRRYGRHKLAPTISPGKTWEGFAAGILFAPTIVAIGLSFFQAPSLFSFPQLILLAVLSQGGDLMESKLKRHLGIKDTGTLLRGHGGIIDRVDGFILAAPVAWLMSSVGS